MILALFDFDGTITSSDSFIKFICFVVGDIKALWGMLVLTPMLIAYKLKFIPNDHAKQRMLTYFFEDMDEQQFRQLAEKYSLTCIDTILRPKAMERIAWHKEQGHKIVVVSASIAYLLGPWCDKHQLDLLATKLEIKDGVVTGKLLTRNCYGAEKVNRIKAAYKLDNYEYIYAYGDSKGDKELLELADEKYYNYF